MTRIIDSDGNAHETSEQMLSLSTDALEASAYALARVARASLELIDKDGLADGLAAMAYRLEGYRLVSERDAQITASDLDSQREFSTKAFGPGRRTGGVLDHIRKELDEVQDHPTDLLEWVDVVILALDGAWRAGHEPEAIIKAYHSKMEANRARIWPDWRELSEDVAIEHDRSHPDQHDSVREAPVVSPIAHEHARIVASLIPATPESIGDVVGPALDRIERTHDQLRDDAEDRDEAWGRSD
jgi:hypothetical protein